MEKKVNVPKIIGLVILGIVLLAAVVTGLGYFEWMGNKSESKAPVQVEAPVEQVLE